MAERPFDFPVALGALAVATSFIVQPLIPFIGGDWFFLNGLLMAASALFFYLSLIENHGKGMLWFYGILFACGFLGMTASVWIAEGRLAKNKLRCSKIQHEMLAAKPRRDDLPEIFQALGCHPRGDEEIAFPPVPPPSKVLPKPVMAVSRPSVAGTSSNQLHQQR